MKAYLILTAILFGLLAFVHLVRTIVDRSHLATDPGFWLEGPGIGLIAAVLRLVLRLWAVWPPENKMCLQLRPVNVVRGVRVWLAGWGNLDSTQAMSDRDILEVDPRTRHLPGDRRDGVDP